MTAKGAKAVKHNGTSGTWKVYHQATVKPFSAELLATFGTVGEALQFLDDAAKTHTGRVSVVNPDGRTIKSIGIPAPDPGAAS